jgi:hypothetical protein
VVWALLLASTSACTATTTESNQWIAVGIDLRTEFLHFDVVLESSASKRRLTGSFRHPKRPEEIAATATLTTGARWEPLEASSEYRDLDDQERLEPAEDGGFVIVRSVGGRKRTGLPVDAEGLYAPGPLPGLAYAMCELAGDAPVLRPAGFGTFLRISPRSATDFVTSGSQSVAAVTLGLALAQDGPADLQIEAWCAGQRPVVVRNRNDWQFLVGERTLLETIADASSSGD